MAASWASDDLRVLLAACRTGSFGRAAEQLRLSQPSVSERIAGLERRLGAALFERTRRGVRLTDAGERLVPYAERCLALLDEAETVVRAATPVTRFRVGVHGTFAPTVVPHVVDALARRHVAAAVVVH